MTRQIGKLFLDSSYESRLAQQSRQEEVRLGIRTIAQIEATDDVIIAHIKETDSRIAAREAALPKDAAVRRRLKLEWAKENFLPLEDYL